MKVGYLGPTGTFSEEALLASGLFSEAVKTPIATVYSAVLAVQNNKVDLALVPIENSLEGSVNATLDALVIDAPDVHIVGELVHNIDLCLITAEPFELAEITRVISHPQPLGQCAAFIANQLPDAVTQHATSTVDAVRTVADSTKRWAAVGSHAAAKIYDCKVLKSDIADRKGNKTRFVWLSRKRKLDGLQLKPEPKMKTSIVFSGSDSGSPGWLVSCLAEFSNRGVNLTKIESRPLGEGLGSYMFFIDLEGDSESAAISSAIESLKERVQKIRILGSYYQAA